MKGETQNEVLIKGNVVDVEMAGVVPIYQLVVVNIVQQCIGCVPFAFKKQSAIYRTVIGEIGVMYTCPVESLHASQNKGAIYFNSLVNRVFYCCFIVVEQRLFLLQRNVLTAPKHS